MVPNASPTPRGVPPSHRMRDPARVLRAVLTNQIARIAPDLYVRLTGQTGRGAAAEEAPSDVGRYFRRCVDDVLQRLGVGQDQACDFLRDQVVLEYGPGDLPGVALLLVAKGARKVYCVDRFPLVRLTPKNGRVIAGLLASLSGQERARMQACLRNPDDPCAGFDPQFIESVVRPGGLSGLRDAADVVISRAVLEHVNDLPATFADMCSAMRTGARAVHLVDLRSHGLHREHQLDFLAWPPLLWHLMYSEKGVPNRWRIDHYRSILRSMPELRTLEMSTTRTAGPDEVRAVRPMLAAPFRGLCDEDLACLGFWLVLQKTPPGAAA